MNKRLLFITPGLGKGGAETQLLKVAQFFRGRGFEVGVVSLRPINNFSSSLAKSTLKVYFLEDWNGNFFSNWVKLVKIVKSFNPQVVIAFMFIAIIFARILKPFFRFNLISSVRNSIIGAKWFHLFKLTKTFDDVVVYNADSSKWNFEQEKLVLKKGVVINNAIALPDEALILQRSRNSEFVWISIAHFRPSKDYATLFKAIALIKERKFRVEILGHVNNLEWPYRMIKDLGISEKVKILGFKDNTQEYLSKADALVLSSFNEGMPNAILEAMANCKPIIGSEIDGIKGLVINSRCGLLFQQGDAQDLADKMLSIMGMTDEQRLHLGYLGRDYIANYFSEEAVFSKWLDTVEIFFKERNISIKLA